MTKPAYEQLEQERDELVAQAERLGEAAHRLSFSIVFDEIDLHPATKKQFSDLQDVIELRGHHHTEATGFIELLNGVIK